MISGLYQSALGMLNQMESHRVISENMAAVSVPGYRRSLVSFESYLNADASAKTGPNESNPVSGKQLFPAQVPTMRTTMDFSEGQVMQDGNPQHAAISGPAFFGVEMPNGTRAYTRDGGFHVNPQGEIVTSNGWKVLGEDNQGLTLPKPHRSFLIAETGDILQEGISVGKLQLTAFKDPANALRWAGGNYFVTANAAVQPDPEAAPSRLLQGYVEGSNVNTVQEMVSMVNAMRVYEANQKMLQSQDSTLGDVIRQVASRG